MVYNAISLGKTSLILMAMSKNPALLQKVLKGWFTLPERRELFPGLLLALKLPICVKVSHTNVPEPSIFARLSSSLVPVQSNLN